MLNIIALEQLLCGASF